ncbi:MAG TPA: DUF167 family protein [Hyphomicrobiaceae bacterium]|nr:DUF167 family protein [Hyphomicrobiaceae bacterium]
MRASPKSSREGIAGVVPTVEGPALAVRVHAAAQKGQANRAVELALAAWLGVPRISVTVKAGGKSRIKTVLVAGEPAMLAALLQRRTASARLPSAVSQ